MSHEDKISKEIFDLIFCQAISCDNDIEAATFLQQVLNVEMYSKMDGKEEFFSKINAFLSNYRTETDKKKVLTDSISQIRSLMGLKEEKIISLSGATGSW